MRWRPQAPTDVAATALAGPSFRPSTSVQTTTVQALKRATKNKMDSVWWKSVLMC